MANGRKFTEVEEPKRFRSPPYPFMALPRALERARRLYEIAKHHEVDLEILGKAWSYGLKSSGLVQTASALIQFGLLANRGVRTARKFQLTPEAIRMIEDPDPRSELYRAGLQRAALRPKAFAELAQRYGERGALDSDLKDYLTRGRQEAGESLFSAEAAAEVISRYKETLSFAGMDMNTAERSLALGVQGMEKASPRSELLALPGHQQVAPANAEKQMSENSWDLQKGERVLQHGILGCDTSYRIIVRGRFGVMEIERLIAKLQFDKEILMGDRADLVDVNSA